MTIQAAGRAERRLKAPWKGTDALFGSQRLDETTITDGVFAYCTFVNVSFLKTAIESSRFLSCTFIDCYFRDTHLSLTDFTGSTFVDCNFRHIKVDQCDLKYTAFQGCYLPFDEVWGSRPREPNIRQELTHGLYLAASAMGDPGEARRYRLASLSARRRHLEAGILHATPWYAEHFPGPRRIRAVGEWCWYWLNRGLWKHGESAVRLVLNAALLVAVIGPLLAVAALDRMENYRSALNLTISSFVGAAGPNDYGGLGEQAFSLGANLLGLLFIGLFVTTFVKSLLRR
jgi:hypothetical protein